MSTSFQFVKSKRAHTGYHPRLRESQSIPSHLILRMGFSDFSGEINETNEELIIPGNPPGKCRIPVRITDAYWNSGENDYQLTPP